MQAALAEPNESLLPHFELCWEVKYPSTLNECSTVRRGFITCPKLAANVEELVRGRKPEHTWKIPPINEYVMTREMYKYRDDPHTDPNWTNGATSKSQSDS